MFRHILLLQLALISLGFSASIQNSTLQRSRHLGSPRHPLRNVSHAGSTNRRIAPIQPHKNATKSNKPLPKPASHDKVSQKSREFDGYGPYSFDFLYGGNNYLETEAEVIFLDYDSEENVIASFLDEGKRVICYVNVGAWEEWRADADAFPESVLGNDYEGWPGENWLDITDLDTLLPIMAARFALAASKGCEGIDLDNVNGYTIDTGFDLTYDDQLTYNLAIADEVHSAGMLVGLKNDGDQADDLVDSFDFAVLESCAAYDGECGLFESFIAADKPVFDIEYTEVWDEAGFEDSVCPMVDETGISFILKEMDLNDGFIVSCL